MRLELDPSEPDTRGIRRIARKRIGKALDSLQATRSSDVAIHTARKELKKARATLRLLRDSMSDAAYHRENAALRDAARPLGPIRDGKALLDALADLVEHFDAAAKCVPVNGLKRSLRRDRADARRRIFKRAQALRQQRAALRTSGARADKWRVGHRGWDVIGSGLKRTYGKGRRAARASKTNCTVENLHEWRKQAKYLRYQLEILRPLWPGLIGELVDQVHQLTDYLGDDHDLAVLRDKAMGNRGPDSTGPSALIELIDRRRAELRDQAFVLGRLIYEEQPKVFAARFEKYWDDWKKQPKGVSEWERPDPRDYVQPRSR